MSNPRAAAPARARARADGVFRVGRIAARVGWAAGAVALAALGTGQLLTAVLAARDLGTAVGSTSGVVGSVGLAVLLVAGGLTCLACVPGCVARLLRRRLPARRPRHPGAVRVLEVCARVLAGACLVAAALEAHESGHLPAAVSVGAGPTLSGIVLHPAALIVVGVGAAALSRRWSRVAGRAAILTPGRGRLPR